MAVYLYFQHTDLIGERDERIIDAAREIIEREAEKAIASLRRAALI